MGYTTVFKGSFKFDKPLTIEHQEFLTRFSQKPQTLVNVGPRLWCQWIPNDNGDEIIWDGEENFYNYVEWLGYIVDQFLKPWGYILNGEVDWRGEKFYDLGTIVVKDNIITVTHIKNRGQCYYTGHDMCRKDMV